MGITLKLYQAKTQSFSGTPKYWQEDTLFPDFEEYFKSRGPQNGVSDLFITVVFASLDALRDRATIEQLVAEGDNALRQITSAGGRLSSTYAPEPMIMIGQYDIMGLYREDATIPDPFIEAIREEIDPRFRFFDSSIWHRYVPMYHPAQKKEVFADRFKAAIKAVIGYHTLGLYNSLVAHEYLEFQCRKLQNSFLVREPKGHSQQVTPFRFHSESLMHKLTSEKLLGNIKDFQWGCILIDDFAEKHIRPFGDRKPEPKVNKISLIKDLLNSEKDSIVNINNYYPSIDSILDSDPKPDVANIIILDYYLGDNKDSKPEYGHKLLDKIETQEVSLQKPDYLEHYWIFPVSAFEHAFQSHLHARGYGSIDSNFLISDSADPVNTPELFRNLFYRFLDSYKKRVFDMRIERLKKLIKEIGGLKNGDASVKKNDDANVRKIKHICRKYHSHIVALTANFELIKDEESGTGDAFARSTKKEPIKTRLDNVYLLAAQVRSLIGYIILGTDAYWDKLWGSYIRMKSTTYNISHYSIINSDIHSMLDVIEAHILTEKPKKDSHA